MFSTYLGISWLFAQRKFCCTYPEKFYFSLFVGKKEIKVQRFSCEGSISPEIKEECV